MNQNRIGRPSPPGQGVSRSARRRRARRALENRRPARVNQRMVVRQPAPRQVGAAVSYGTQVLYRNPKLEAKGQELTVSHMEPIASVYGANGTATDYHVESWEVNPGMGGELRGYWAWLPGIANNYERYVVEKLHYVFRPSCPTSTPGTMAVTFDTDALDQPPRDFMTFLANSLTVSGSPWLEKRLVVPEDLLKTMKVRYVRDGLPWSTADLKTYDIGTLRVSSEGLSATTHGLLGILWAEYRIRFYTPCLHRIASGTFEGDTTTGSAANLLGSNPSWASANTVRVVKYDPMETYLEFVKPFQGLIEMVVGGTGFTGPITNASLPSSTTTLVDYSSGNYLHKLLKVKADVGDALALATPAITTLTDVRVMFSQGNYAAF